MLKLAGSLAMSISVLVAVLVSISHAHGGDRSINEGTRRIRDITSIDGLAAFWDFVARDAQGRFVARTSSGGDTRYPLDALNYVREYWNEGLEASYRDFPLLNKGPFGQGVVIRREEDPTFRPTLLLRREHFHNGPLDVGGPGRSVSMAVWMVHQTGNHAVAGIWHEGTDLKQPGTEAARVEAGRRQYALFAGLAANNGASAVHVSENGKASFGDRYARNLAVTPDRIPSAGLDADDSKLQASWRVAGFVFDNERNTATAYLDGVAGDYWIEEGLFQHPFFRWPANAWRQGQLRKQPGLQESEDPNFPPDQFYEPPEIKPLKRRVLTSTPSERVTELTYEFTKVRLTEKKDASRGWTEAARELQALRANPFWFGHNLYQPGSAADGGPFTIGRVIHSSRSVGMTGVIGGVAVYNRALRPDEMRKLSEVGFTGKGSKRKSAPIPLPPAKLR